MTLKRSDLVKFYDRNYARETITFLKQNPNGCFNEDVTKYLKDNCGLTVYDHASTTHQLLKKAVEFGLVRKTAIKRYVFVTEGW